MPRKVYTYPDDSLTKPLTDKQAIQAGFCPGCGWFVAGHEADDRSIREFGLCYECVEEIKIETGEYDEPDDDEYFVY